MNVGAASGQQALATAANDVVSIAVLRASMEASSSQVADLLGGLEAAAPVEPIEPHKGVNLDVRL